MSLPSTSLARKAGKNVDARHKPGHDGDMLTKAFGASCERASAASKRVFLWSVPS